MWRFFLFNISQIEIFVHWLNNHANIFKMKKIAIIILITLINANNFAQKKKSSSNKSAVTSSFAKADNLVAEVKKGNFQLIINENGKEKDALIIKAADSKFLPIDCKLISFSANGTKLYLLSWTEKNQLKTDLKTENISTIYSVIYEIINKKQVFSNTQLSKHIIEKVFLDKNKTASETQEKIRKEGFELIVNPDGTLTQKSKTQTNIWVYDTTKMEFVPKKK